LRQSIFIDIILAKFCYFLQFLKENLSLTAQRIVSLKEHCKDQKQIIAYLRETM
jgi:hypothetical protein